MTALSPDEVALAAQLACILEADAWKPGNISRLHDFSDCRFEDFLASAVAIGPSFRDAARSSVGKTMLGAVKATRELVGTNTNLGIAILLAPLAKAAGMDHAAGLRAAVMDVLEALDVEDARLAYEAIRLAAPAGLGTVERCDVTSGEVDVTLRRAMELAADRDSIASEYVTGFELTFNVGYAALMRLREAGCRFSDAIVQSFLTILAGTPDSLIARKNGLASAERVSAQAGDVLDHGGVLSERGREELKKLDVRLRENGHGLNPGTTADLTAASIFVYLVEGGMLNRFKDLLRCW